MRQWVQSFAVIGPSAIQASGARLTNILIMNAVRVLEHVVFDSGGVTINQVKCDKRFAVRMPQPCQLLLQLCSFMRTHVHTHKSAHGQHTYIYIGIQEMVYICILLECVVNGSLQRGKRFNVRICVVNGSIGCDNMFNANTFVIHVSREKWQHVTVNDDV